LLQNAKQLVIERQSQDHSLVCAYLSGSLAASEDVEQALIGGAGDIDLVFVHSYLDQPYRELIPLTKDLHHDIWHVAQSLYDDPKQLRGNPWIGHDLFSKPQVFLDKNHWFDFVLAGAFSKYNLPENVVLRCLHFITAARKGLQTIAFSQQTHAEWLITYLQALSDSTNALALLNGGPLGMRRMILDLPARAAALDAPQWTSRLIEAYSNGVPGAAQLEDWMAEWKTHFSAVPKDGPIELSPIRTNYYLKAMETLRETQPMASVWIMLRTLALYLSTVSADLSTPGKAGQTQYLAALDLAPENAAERSENLENFVDDCEETLEQWAIAMGVPFLAE
jgi:hypothetical protein